MRTPSSSAALLNPPDAVWAELTNAFQIDDPEAVRSFLADHPSLPALLLEIREAARRYFGDDPMVLKIFIDPEWEDAEPELIAVIWTQRGRDALACLKKFDHEWWLPKLEESKAPVLVTMNHVKRV